MTPTDPPAARGTNRLAAERSPYLRQHMHNPVDWWPWGPEAFAAARRLDRPVFLSVGYAACHWCHVMERESFEDEGVAAALNEAFVCVKVDREERPDVDDVYMAAVQATTGRGGWPMSCFLTPQGRPFLARTYLRPQELTSLAERVEALWGSPDRVRLLEVADEVAVAVRDHVAGPSLPPPDATDGDLVARAVAGAAAEFDRERGGFDRVPKFPPHAHLLFFLDRGGTAGGAEGLAMARRTLDAMAAGGVFDQVGGGFHRYATDADWFLPHFEKMLYDNALLAAAYARAHAVGGGEAPARVARETLAWVVRDLAVEGGGYASSLDADTAGHEGLTYTWTVEELRAALSPEDARLAMERYGARPEGNFHEEGTGRATGRNVLAVARTPEALARDHDRPLEAVLADLDRVRAALLAARSRRPQPARDDKVLTAWNGLLLGAFATAGRALAEPGWTARARALARFLLDRSREGGALLRFPSGSGPRVPGFLDDHAHLADGLLDLADATGEETWAREAAGLADAMRERFEDPSGGFFSTAADHEALLARPREVFDSPIPSANATAARVLLRLAARTGATSYRESADRAIAALRPLAARLPSATMAAVRAIADRAAVAAPAAAGADARTLAGPARVDAYLDRREARPGGAVRLLVRVTLEAGWHVAEAGGGPGTPSSLSLRAAPGSTVALEDVRLPAATRRAPAPGAAPIPLHEGTFDLRASLRLPEGSAPGPCPAAVVLAFQPCRETECLAPREVRLDLPLRIGAQDVPGARPDLFA